MFAFLLLPILVAIDLPAVPSVWILVITVVLLSASCKKFLTRTASVADLPATCITKPDADFPVVGQPAQSASL